MKKILTGFLSVLLSFTCVSARGTSAELVKTIKTEETEITEETGTAEEGENNEPKKKPAVDIHTEYAALIDAGSGKILFQENGNTPADPASLTKIMTVYLAVKTLSDSQQITMSSDAFQTYDHNKGVLWIQEGETLSAKDCEYAALLASANDTAAMLAEAVAVTQDAFVQRMNAEVQELGLENTVFDNIFGYSSEGTRSSAIDMAMITRQAIRNGSFSKVFGSSGYTISATNKMQQSRAIAQDCELLRNGQYSYDDVTGGKIGSTSSGTFALAASAKRGATSLIAVVLAEESADNAYRDIVKMFEYGFQNAQTVTISPEQIGTETVEVKQNGKTVANVTFSADSSFSILMPKEMDPAGLKAEIVVNNREAEDPDEISAEVHFLMNDDLIGTAAMEKKVTTVEPEPDIIEKSGGFRGVFDLVSIGVLAAVLILPFVIRVFASLAPPKE